MASCSSDSFVNITKNAFAQRKDLTTDDKEISETRYAILSHTWASDPGDEVSYRDTRNPQAAKQKKGFDKVFWCCDEALKNGFEWVWIDSCCIDKTSSAELSEAINSMYRWYEQSSVCYAYLSDVDTIKDLRDSRWFTRGWTLQELIAPRKVIFFSKDWEKIATKSELRAEIARITNINQEVLHHPWKMTRYSIAQRMSWASRRSTSKPEDIAYCLLGIMGVNMPLVYGERERAFVRLQEEIIKNSDDQSIFAWMGEQQKGWRNSLFAYSPADFTDSKAIVPERDSSREKAPYSMTNIGLSIRIPLTNNSKYRRGENRNSNGIFFAYLNCFHLGHQLAILVRFSSSNVCYRIDVSHVYRLSHPARLRRIPSEPVFLARDSFLHESDTYNIAQEVREAGRGIFDLETGRLCPSLNAGDIPDGEGRISGEESEPSEAESDFGRIPGSRERRRRSMKSKGTSGKESDSEETSGSGESQTEFDFEEW